MANYSINYWPIVKFKSLSKACNVVKNVGIKHNMNVSGLLNALNCLEICIVLILNWYLLYRIPKLLDNPMFCLWNQLYQTMRFRLNTYFKIPLCIWVLEQYTNQRTKYFITRILRSWQLQENLVGCLLLFWLLQY